MFEGIQMLDRKTRTRQGGIFVSPICISVLSIFVRTAELGIVVGNRILVGIGSLVKTPTPPTFSSYTGYLFIVSAQLSIFQV